MVLAMVLAAAGLRDAGEARAAAGAAVGECCSVEEGRELGRAGGGSAGERERERNFSLSCIGEGNGNPLQSPRPETPVGGGAR